MSDAYKVKISVSTGKKLGRVYRLDEGQDWIEVGREKGPTLKHLSRKLRGKGLVPTNIVLNKKGETFFSK